MNVGGIGLLNDSERSAAEDFITQLSNYGIFVVSHGGVESWLPQFALKVPRATGCPPDLRKNGRRPR